MHILILMGHTNDATGKLSVVARSRCKAVFEFISANPDARVLVTGGWGSHFNTTDAPHGKLLARHLETLGVDPKRIFRSMPGNGTVEDALLARNVVLDHDISTITVLTSAYHMPRVEFIFSRVFADLEGVEVDFLSVPDPAFEMLSESEKKEIRNANAALNQLRAEWCAIPYPSKSDHQFPDKVFVHAAEMHKHFDNLSYFVISAIFVVFGFAFTNQPAPDDPDMLFRAALNIVSSIVILLLLGMYWRMARTADGARRIMRWIEVAYGQFGFHTNYQRKQFDGLGGIYPDSFLISLRNGLRSPKTFVRAALTIRGSVTVIAVLMIIALLVVGFVDR